ncbi:hypothetical protein PVAND_000686 [Polypedilum vanderplanki]|uniref:Uncharacterized protein n=1 Tax=Polypedilum vanderplanki TaxID=319348 RepID=A0A9J6BKQ1_POLVA|nr:hypothetical protein PVAND_000686 [Polypedilum vanderplanki]
MKCLKVLLIIFMFFYRTSEVESLAENFPNFQCFVSLSSCTIFDIDSTDGLQKIYDDLKNLHFEYETQSSSRECLLFSECNTIKNDFEDFKMLQFRDSHFEKFPSGDNKKLNHIRKLFAIDVGLTEIDRDDFEAFQSLKVLNLSHNSLEAIDGLFLIHLTSLTTLNLRNNFISKIDDLVLNEYAKKLEFLDLSFNELTEISENLFDIFGKNSNAQLLLENNRIERIIPSTIAVNSSRKFKTLSLSGNKLKNFVYNCTSIDILSLDDNQLETFDISNCSVEVLNLQNNNLITIKVPPTVIFLSISNNMNLQS